MELRGASGREGRWEWRTLGVGSARATKLVVLLATVESGAVSRPVVEATIVTPPWLIDEGWAVAARLSAPSPRSEADGCWVAPLPEALRNAREPRVVTFLAGRYCAEQALRAGGLTGRLTVGFGAEREPIWPDGFVGSITHTSQYAGAVVARRDSVVSIGIDTEELLSPAQALEVRQTVAPEYGRINFVGLDADGGRDAHALSCLFSAKESIYKCLHPLVREFFEFSDVSVTKVDRTSGTIHTVLNRPLGTFPRHWPIDVRFVLTDDHVHTSAVLRASQIPSGRV
jgi:enterobactin synthetase component D